MPKPIKKRTIQFPPPVDYFKPRGIPMNRLEQIVLTLDEVEALRLVDSTGLNHAEAATHLGVSRATCARILESAHKKVADAITQGKAIQIQGGCFDFRHRRFLCNECGHSWEITNEHGTNTHLKETCPSCGSEDMSDLSERYTPPHRHGGGHRRDPGGKKF